MVLDTLDTSTLVIAEALGRLIHELRRLDLQPEESADFRAFEAAALASEDRYLMEDFSSRFFDLHAGNAFWIGVKDADGSIASLQAAKMDELRDRPLAAFWQQQQRRIFVDPVGGDTRFGSVPGGGVGGRARSLRRSAARGRG